MSTNPLSLRRALVPALAALLIAPLTTEVAAGAQSAERHGAEREVLATTQNDDRDPIVVRGTKVGSDGCEFSLSEEMPPEAVDTGLHRTRYSEISYDHENCTTVLELSEPTGLYVDPTGDRESIWESQRVGVNPDEFSSSDFDVQSSHWCENPGRDTTVYYAHAACIHSWFEDPPGIHVNDLTNEIQWWPSGTCANAGRSAASYFGQWLGETGWRIGSNGWNPTFSCSAVSSTSAMQYINDIFCAFTVTVTSYDQKISGLAGGGWRWNVKWFKKGPCSFMLSFHTEQWKR